MSRYLGARISTRVGAQHALNNDYFDRIEALDYAIAHDDGQGGQDLTQADVILVGVSRTSKTPTCIYLAHRGVRAANVPLVPGDPARRAVHPEEHPDRRPDDLARAADPDPPQPLLSLKENRESDYIDTDAVRQEIIAARRLFERQGWPIIDVTRRSVEETAAAIINLLSGGRGQVEVLG
jgi:regulator of PEP synthase PpsR (kinase-PPPase family)